MTIIKKSTAIAAIIRGDARYSGITCDHTHGDHGCWVITDLKHHRVDHVVIEDGDSIDLIANAIHNDDI